MVSPQVDNAQSFFIVTRKDKVFVNVNKHFRPSLIFVAEVIRAEWSKVRCHDTQHSDTQHNNI
jgi:hypothetical protein